MVGGQDVRKMTCDSLLSNISMVPQKFTYSLILLKTIFVSKSYGMLLMNIQTKKAGGNIGRVLLVEFADNENAVFDEIMEVIKKIQIFKNLK